jgi:hypothetical protein
MKNLCLVTIVMAIIATGITHAQTDLRWMQTYGGQTAEVGAGAQQTSDGGYIIAGRTDSFGSGGDDVYLVRTDANGQEVWSKTFGGTGDDTANSVQVTTDGGYIIAGRTESFGAGGNDVYLIKADSDGNKIWSRTFGGTKDDRAYDVKQTTDGGYVIVGTTYSFGAGVSDVYQIKTDANGIETWSEYHGGINGDHGRKVLQTSDGGYAIVGTTYSFGPRNDNVYLVKTDDVGFKTWHQTYGGDSIDKGFDIQPTLDGGHVIVGHTVTSAPGPWDVYLIKLDALWVNTWTRTFGGSGYDEGHSVMQTSDGGYIIAGRTDSFGAGDNDLYLIKTDADGIESWSQTSGRHLDDGAYEILLTSGGGYTIVGDTESYGAGNKDAWLIRLAEPDFDLDYGPKPVMPGQWMLFRITQAAPNRSSWIACSLSGFGCQTLPILNVTMGIDSPRTLLGPKTTDSQGQCDFPLFVPPGASGVTVWIQAVQHSLSSDIEEISIQ